jgi:hypothetical protein
MAHICDSFAFLVFHLFRADGAKPSRRRKQREKRSGFSGRALPTNVRPRAFQDNKASRLTPVQEHHRAGEDHLIGEPERRRGLEVDSYLKLPVAWAAPILRYVRE